MVPSRASFRGPAGLGGRGGRDRHAGATRRRSARYESNDRSVPARRLDAQPRWLGEIPEPSRPTRRGTEPAPFPPRTRPSRDGTHDLRRRDRSEASRLGAFGVARGAWSMKGMHGEIGKRLGRRAGQRTMSLTSVGRSPLGTPVVSSPTPGMSPSSVTNTISLGGVGGPDSDRRRPARGETLLVGQPSPVAGAAKTPGTTVAAAARATGVHGNARTRRALSKS